MATRPFTAGATYATACRRGWPWGLLWSVARVPGPRLLHSSACVPCQGVGGVARTVISARPACAPCVPPRGGFIRAVPIQGRPQSHKSGAIRTQAISFSCFTYISPYPHSNCHPWHLLCMKTWSRLVYSSPPQCLQSHCLSLLLYSPCHLCLHMEPC